MKLFYSCDWGTSAFRLRLVNAADATILSEIRTEDGMKDMYNLWKATGKSDDERAMLYEDYLFEQVNKLKKPNGLAVDDMPVVLSGMVSSSIGMLELPYKQLPFKIDGTDLLVHEILRKNDSKQKMFIISGVRSDTDVMRGEETMLAGCGLTKNADEEMLIFPGTHSKHVTIQDGVVKKIKTYITGELFRLLSTQSILAASVTEPNEQNDLSDPHFADGVAEALSSNLLNSVFHVRTNQLFQRMLPSENYSYLSGLLLGYELKEINDAGVKQITLVCSKELTNKYMSALNIAAPGVQVKQINADEALMKGQLNVLLQTGFSILSS